MLTSRNAEGVHGQRKVGNPWHKLSIKGTAYKNLFSKWGRRKKKFGKPWHRGSKHYILYCLENDSFKTA